MCIDIQIKEERISSIEYIEFLKRTDLGSQYPKERFEERMAKLVDHVSISLIARNKDNQIVGVLFGLTDYAYWLYITDLGVDRDYLHQGIGTELIKTAHSLAGGKKDMFIISVCILASFFLFNYSADKLSGKVQMTFDMSKNAIFDLTEETQSYLDSMEEEVTMYYLGETNNENPYIVEVLERYGRAADKLTLKTVDLIKRYISY